MSERLKKCGQAGLHKAVCATPGTVALFRGNRDIAIKEDGAGV